MVAIFGFQVASAYFRQALIAMPLFLGSGCIMQVSLCGFFFQEFRTFDHQSTIGFLTGLAVVLAGLAVTSRAPGHSEEEEEIPTFEPAERIESAPPAPGKPIIPRTVIDNAADGTHSQGSGHGRSPGGSASVRHFQSTDILMVGVLDGYTFCFGGNYTIGTSKPRGQLPSRAYSGQFPSRAHSTPTGKFKKMGALAPLLPTQT